jgi:hypothetical protein
MWIAIQFTISVLAGSAAIWWDHHLWGADHGNGIGLTLWGFIVGLVVTRAVMFLIIWRQFGRQAARSMRMLD